MVFLINHCFQLPVAVFECIYLYERVLEPTSTVACQHFDMFCIVFAHCITLPPIFALIRMVCFSASY